MKGLTSGEAARLLEKNGENTIETQKKNGALKIFAGQFKDIMVMILLGATVISVFLGEIYDAVTVIAIVFLNALLGFIQEFKTEKTLEALKNMTAPTAKVIRDSKIQTIPAAQVVLGDIIVLNTGDRVAADCVILEQNSLTADESMLTGESENVIKCSGDSADKDNSLNRHCIAYSGTVVTGGNGIGKVIATGKNSQMGNISTMISKTEVSKTPLQKRLGELGKVLAFICIAVCIVVAGAGILRGEPVFDMLMTGITIAIAAIPEGLPATVTIALALAVNRMLKQKALVNKLHSVETLGCTSVICSDKTGTITENKMTVKKIFSDMKEFEVTGNGFKTQGEIKYEDTNINPKACLPLYELFKCAIYCSTAQINPSVPLNSRNRGSISKEGVWEVSGNPTEAALLIAAAKGGITKENSGNAIILSQKPFDSSTKTMYVTLKDNKGRVLTYIKGAPDIIIEKCGYIKTSKGENPLNLDIKRRIYGITADYSKKALRVLALAFREGEGETVFLGLAAMQDPPREEAKTAIKKAFGAKIKTVMITGDHKDTAVAIAKQAGILRNRDAMTGEELDQLSDKELEERLESVGVFARVNPSHKLRLVKAYKRKNHIVTMTGDGVNDAPAIKAADVGVAMGVTGTDVAKQAADVILLDDNFATLVNAVEQGRGIYSNIRKFVRYLLSCNIGEVITMFLCIIMGMPVILLPTQLLLVNLITDGLPAIALGMEPCSGDVMKKPPRKPEESFFSDGLMFKIIIRGVLIGLSTLACFTVLIGKGFSVETARTGALFTLIISQLIHVFECKSETKGIFSLNYFDNPKLLGAVLISLAVLLGAVYIPFAQNIFSTSSLGNVEILISLLFSLAVPVINGISFMFVRKKL